MRIVAFITEPKVIDRILESRAIAARGLLGCLYVQITHLSSAVSLFRKPKSAVYGHSSSWRNVAKLSWASRHVHFGEAYFAGVKGKSYTAEVVVPVS